MTGRNGVGAAVIVATIPYVLHLHARFVPYMEINDIHGIDSKSVKLSDTISMVYDTCHRKLVTIYIGFSDQIIVAGLSGPATGLRGPACLRLLSGHVDYGAKLSAS